jgi:hypothetical protein
MKKPLRSVCGPGGAFLGGTDTLSEAMNMTDLNLSLVIRYGYAGMLFTTILLVLNRSFVKSLTESAGAVLTPFIVVTIGACIYVVYRHLLGEFILYRLAHFFDNRGSKKNRGTTGALSPHGYLEQLGVPKRQRRDAYNAMRREYLSEPLKKQLDLAHAEVHILYITFVEGAGLAVYLPFSSSSWWTFWIVTISALLVLFCAIAADIKQHRYELNSILSVKQIDELKSFLAARGYKMHP